MADTSLIRIDEVTEGTTIRVVLSASVHPRTTRNRATGLFRVLPNGVDATMDNKVWKRLVGTSKRRFVARVIENDALTQELTLEFDDAQTTQRGTHVRYRAIIPYKQILRLARLVPLGREFSSVEAELVYRRNHRSSHAVNKLFFDAKDRFVAVSLLAPLPTP